MYLAEGKHAGVEVEHFDQRRVARGTRDQFENIYLPEMCSGSEAGSYLRLIDFVPQKYLAEGEHDGVEIEHFDQRRVRGREHLV